MEPLTVAENTAPTCAPLFPMPWEIGWLGWLTGTGQQPAPWRAPLPPWVGPAPPAPAAPREAEGTKRPPSKSAAVLPLPSLAVPMSLGLIKRRRDTPWLEVEESARAAAVTMWRAIAAMADTETSGTGRKLALAGAEGERERPSRILFARRRPRP